MESPRYPELGSLALRDWPSTKRSQSRNLGLEYANFTEVTGQRSYDDKISGTQETDLESDAVVCKLSNEDNCSVPRTLVDGEVEFKGGAVVNSGHCGVTRLGIQHRSSCLEKEESFLNQFSLN